MNVCTCANRYTETGGGLLGLVTIDYTVLHVLYQPTHIMSVPYV